MFMRALLEDCCRAATRVVPDPRYAPPASGKLRSLCATDTDGMRKKLSTGSDSPRAPPVRRRYAAPASKILRFPGAVKRDPAIAAWMREHAGELGTIAQRWFEVMRDCGDDVRELLHDGHPTACIGDAAFAYVNAFKAHVNVGFFRGAEISDPEGLLQGTGKFMRHVKLGPGRRIDATALGMLIETAYTDMTARLAADRPSPMREEDEVSANECHPIRNALERP